MRYFNLKYCLFIILGILMISSCKDDIKLDPNGNYDNIHDTYGFVKNVSGARDLATISIFGNAAGNGILYYELSKASGADVTVQFVVDEEALTAFNQANNTSYKMYPADKVSFSKNGSTTIASGSKKSEEITMTVVSNGEVGSTYAIPVSVKASEGGQYKSSEGSYYIYLVTPLAAIPSSDKGTGIKTICYIEVNDENILNVGEYIMKSSGKPFIDVVNIFAANINIDSNTKRAYINSNENITNILQNVDKYVRPLQAKGIKVCLTLLGNHDEAGIANLSAEGAADFAKEIKNYIDLYGLDGVDFDDEYSQYNQENPSPGFEAPSGAAVARLIAECRKIMPDKIISVYDFSAYVPTGSVDGKEVGTLMDYSYWGAYANWADRSSEITGLGKAKYGPSSFNMDFTAGRSGFDLDHCDQIRKEGYGIQMLYNLKPLNYDYSGTFNRMGQILYDDEVVWSGKTYGKTDIVGSTFKPSYESYLGTWKLKPSQGLYWYADGPWWDWKNDVQFTLKIEENVKGQSYKVSGWGLSGTDLPFIMNYNAYGRVEINLPQEVKDSKGETWTYVPRYSYSLGSSRFTMDDVQPAFSGYINSAGSFTIRSFRYKFNQIKTLSPIKYSGGAMIDDIKGGLYQDVAYEPFYMSK